MKYHTAKTFGALLISLWVLSCTSVAHASIYLDARVDIRDKNYENAYKAMKPLGKKGDVLAMRMLAELHFQGSKLPNYVNDNPYFDYQKGFYWARKAAETGDIYAQWYLATWINGRYPDDTREKFKIKKLEALKWHLKAANQGHASSQLWFGKYYLAGFFEKWDHVKAYMWLTLSAKRFEPEPGQPNTGVSFAQNALNAMKRDGEATPEVVKEAMRLVAEWEKKYPNAHKRWTYMQAPDELCDHPSVYQFCSPETKRKRHESSRK